MSQLYLLACSWHGSARRWNNTPTAVTVIGYIIIPCFVLGCVFFCCRHTRLGTRFERFIKPTTDRMRNRRRAEYWIMASVIRDFLVVLQVFKQQLQFLMISSADTRLHTNL